MARTLSRLLALVGASNSSALAWWDRCNCQPAYVYDHTGEPRGSANDWSYPPVGVSYPVTIVPAPSIAPPPGLRVRSAAAYNP